MAANETAIRRQIQDYLRWTGWFVYYNLAGLGSYPGLSDLVAVRGGRVVHIEVKTPKGVQSEKQRRFQRKLEAAGGEYVLARGVEDVEHLDGEKQLSLDRR
jgi:Holliday junction resolvase